MRIPLFCLVCRLDRTGGGLFGCRMLNNRNLNCRNGWGFGNDFVVFHNRVRNVSYFKEETIRRYLLFLVSDKIENTVVSFFGFQPCFFVVKPKLDLLTFDTSFVLSE